MDIKNECESKISKIKVKFPFCIKNKEVISITEAPLERNHGIVSFSLNFNLDLSILNAILISKEKIENKYIYVFEFDNLDSCLDWMNDMEVSVNPKNRNGDVYSIQSEMDEFMRVYEESEARGRKKKKVVDEDGFTYYE